MIRYAVRSRLYQYRYIALLSQSYSYIIFFEILLGEHLNGHSSSALHALFCYPETNSLVRSAIASLATCD